MQTLVCEYVIWLTCNYFPNSNLVGVVIEARHLCMMMRGVEKQHSAAVTSSMLGCFRNEEETRSEFLSLIRQRPNGI